MFHGKSIGLVAIGGPLADQVVTLPIDCQAFAVANGPGGEVRCMPFFGRGTGGDMYRREGGRWVWVPATTEGQP